MKKFTFAPLALIGLLSFGAATMFQSCNDDDDDNAYLLLQPTALVTVCPTYDGTFTMQLDDTTTLHPSNMKSSPFGEKEVRALVNYTEDVESSANLNYVKINWIDSIRTKLPVPTAGELNNSKYGIDPIEIVKDWVTVAEDGYLTLRFRTRWGHTNAPHYINLVSGVNPDNPYEFELHHNAQGDINGNFGDALIAFNLNELPLDKDRNVKIKLNWRSFSGDKSTEFSLMLRPKNNYSEPLEYSRYVK